MQALAEFLIHFVQTTGPAGSIIAAVIVGLALAIIFYAKSHDLFSASRTAEQAGGLLDHYAREVERIASAERELRQNLDLSEAEQDRLKDAQRDLETKIALMRAALRRAIDLLRAVREGRLAPSAIEAIDTIEPPP